MEGRSLAGGRRCGGVGVGVGGGGGGGGGPGREVGHVGEGELAHPAGELEKDAVGVLEVDAAHVHARVHGFADAPLGVVVVGDLGAVDTGGEQALAILL